MSAIAMLANATTTQDGPAIPYAQSLATFQATGSASSGSGSATVEIKVSNDGVVWLLLGTISLTLGTTATSDGFASDAPWAMARADLTSISGTGATVTVTMGV